MTKFKKSILLLVVEDEKVLSKLLEEKLLTEGFDVITALDGQEGLHLALTQKPDLILLDIIMPKVDGLTMLRELRKDPWGKRAPVIVLTNVNNTAKINECLECGLFKNDEYIVKTDTSIEEVISKIKNKLGMNN